MSKTIIIIILLATTICSSVSAVLTMKEESKTNAINSQLKEQLKQANERHVKDSINLNECIDDKMYWINHR